MSIRAVIRGTTFREDAKPKAASIVRGESAELKVATAYRYTQNVTLTGDHILSNDRRWCSVRLRCGVAHLGTSFQELRTQKMVVAQPPTSVSGRQRALIYETVCSSLLKERPCLYFPKS